MISGLRVACSKLVCLHHKPWSPKMPPVVAPKHHDRILPQPEAIHRIQHHAHLRIHKRRRRVVPMHHRTRLLGRQRTDRLDIAVGSQLTTVVPGKVGAPFRQTSIRRRHRQRCRVEQVPITLGRDERQVRSGKPHPQEERLPRRRQRCQSLHRPPGNLAVAELRVRRLRPTPRRSARSPVRLEARPRFSARRRQRTAGGHRRRTPPRGIPKPHAPTGRIDHVPVPPVIDLSQRLSLIARLYETLRHRHRLRRTVPKPGRQVIDPDLVGSKARHQRVARGRTDRLLDVGRPKHHSPLCQLVDARCLGMRIPITAKRRLQIIHADQQHIESIRSRPHRQRKTPQSKGK